MNQNSDCQVAELMRTDGRITRMIGRIRENTQFISKRLHASTKLLARIQKAANKETVKKEKTKSW